jgi:molecular chaperone DnaK
LTLRVAVDFGTSSTCVAVSVDGADPQVVVVDGASPVMSSAVFAAGDGELFVGKEAERQAAIDPARYEPHPKRRIDERELLLGSSVVEVLDVVGAVLRRAVAEARRMAGDAEVDLLVLTHPADWGAVRSRVLRQAGHDLANEVVLVPEPVAAAVFHATGRSLSDGATLAVLDVGGGTVDVSVVRRQSVSARPRVDPATALPGEKIAGFGVLATKGDPNFGGADIDQLLLGHIGSLVTKEDPDAWRRLVEGRELPDRRRRRALAEDIRGAKETLSRHTYTDVPLPPPFPDAHVTRADLERLIAAPLDRTVSLTITTISAAGLRPGELGAVFLVGGSSRIPMVARLVHERTGIVPTTLDQPETVVARGALRAVSREADPESERPTMHMAHPGARARPVVPPIPPGRPPGRMPVRPQPNAPQQAGRPPVAPPPGRTPPRGPVEQPRQPTSSPKPKRWWIVTAVVLGAVLVAGALILFLTGGDDGAAGPSRPEQRNAATGGAAQAGERKQIAQYDYQFTLPRGWQQTGGDSGERRVLIKPSDAVAGADAIAVQEFQLRQNTDTERATVVNQLRDRVLARGSFGFKPSVRYGGKDVVSYRARENGATVDWYVIFDGNIQLSTGCQFTERGKARVGPACEEVVRGMRLTN